MVGFAILSLAAFRPANADEEKQRTEKLEDIVVTATRTEKDISESPASVSVVTQADIEKRDIRSVDEALNTIPGVYSQRYVQGGMLSSLTTINLRGISGGNRTLVMEDGFTMNEPYSGSQKRMLSIEPENIERIEVVKGPFSSLYGGYAMGGVVNIITKMPEKREFTVKTGYGSSSTRGESLDDLKRFYASYGDKLFNKLSVLFNYGHQETSGYSMDESFSSSKPSSTVTGWSQTTNPQGTTRYLIGDAGDMTWSDEKINAKIGFDFSDVSKIVLNFTRFSFDYDFDTPHTYLTSASTGSPVYWPKEATYLASARGPSNTANNIYNLSYETQIADVKSKLKLGVIDTMYGYTAPNTIYATFSGFSSDPSQPAGKITETPTQTYNAGLQFSLPMGQRQILTLGTSYLGGSMNSKRYLASNWKDEDSKTTLDFESKGDSRMTSFYMPG